MRITPTAFQRSIRTGLTFVALALFGIGCASTDLRVQNRDGVVPTGRVVWQAIGVLPRDGRRVVRFSGLSLEADVSYAQGKARQRDFRDDDPPSSVEIGKTSIPTAGGINARAGIVDIKGTLRGGLQLGSFFRLEPMIGFEAVSAEFEASGSGRQASADHGAIGFLYGLRMGIQPHEWVEFYGRAMNGLLDGTGLRVDSAYSFQSEVGVRFAPIDLISLFAGYRWAEYRFQIDKEQTDPKLALDGPVLGLEVRF